MSPQCQTFSSGECRVTGTQGPQLLQEDALRQMADSLPVAVWFQDTYTGEILYVNPAYAEIWGQSTDTLRKDAASFLGAVHPEDRGSLSLIFPGQAGLAVSGVFRILRPDGEIRWVECRTSTVLDGSGEVFRLTVLAEDVTARKMAEAAAEARLRELQHRNAELDAFAHTVAHNLRSPLGLILGNARLLETFSAEHLEPEELESLRHLAQMAEKANQVIEGLLLLSTAGVYGPICEPLAMDRVVDEALARCLPLVEETGACIDLPASWPEALGYAAWVEEVWVNYLDNALKYGGPEPCIVIGAEVLGDGKVRFYVQDSGPGIAESDLVQLYMPFSRLSVSSTEGNGLGLAIVRRIVTRLGGEVAVESVLGKGSTFSFTLPMC